MKNYTGRIVNVDDAERGEFTNKDGTTIKWSRIVIDLCYEDPNNKIGGKRYVKVMVPDTNTFLSISGGKQYSDFTSDKHNFTVVQEYQNNKPRKYETLVGIR